MEFLRKHKRFFIETAGVTIFAILFYIFENETMFAFSIVIGIGYIFKTIIKSIIARK